MIRIEGSQPTLYQPLKSRDHPPGFSAATEETPSQQIEGLSLQIFHRALTYECIYVHEHALDHDRRDCSPLAHFPNRLETIATRLHKSMM